MFHWHYISTTQPHMYMYKGHKRWRNKLNFI